MATIKIKYVEDPAQWLLILDNKYGTSVTEISYAEALNIIEGHKLSTNLKNLSECIQLTAMDHFRQNCYKWYNKIFN